MFTLVMILTLQGNRAPDITSIVEEHETRRKCGTAAIAYTKQVAKDPRWRVVFVSCLKKGK